MWGFVDCTRYYLSFGVPKVVLHEASLIVGTDEKIGLLVPPGGGKSTIIRMLAGVDPWAYSGFCADFSELGEAYFQPLKLYTGGMRGRLAFAASFGVSARTYLADDK